MVSLFLSTEQVKGRLGSYPDQASIRKFSKPQVFWHPCIPIAGTTVWIVIPRTHVKSWALQYWSTTTVMGRWIQADP